MFAALYEGSDCKVSEAFINFATAEVEISSDYANCVYLLAKALTVLP